MDTIDPVSTMKVAAVDPLIWAASVVVSCPPEQAATTPGVVSFPAGIEQASWLAKLGQLLRVSLRAICTMACIAWRVGHNRCESGISSVVGLQRTAGVQRWLCVQCCVWQVLVGDVVMTGGVVVLWS